MSNNLAEALDRFPEPWRPATPGEKLIGEVTDVDLRESDYGDPYPILTVRSEADGQEWSWHAFHAMARSAVRRKQPQVGERVGIVYAGVGEAAQTGMSPPVRWRLIVDRPRPPQFDYDAVPDAEREAEQPKELAVVPDRDDDIPY